MRSTGNLSSADKERRLQAFAMKCLRRILKVSYVERHTNDNVWQWCWMKRSFIQPNDVSVKGWMKSSFSQLNDVSVKGWMVLDEAFVHSTQRRLGQGVDEEFVQSTQRRLGKGVDGVG